MKFTRLNRPRPVRSFQPLAMLSAGALLLGACSPVTPIAPQTAASTAPAASPPSRPARSAAPNTTPAVADGEQPAVISGSFEYTNDFVFTYIVENAVALNDMYGFVTRDREWELPVESQVLGFMELDPDAQRGTFDVQLPVAPRGELVDVDNDGDRDTGVQVFAVAWAGNLSGGPFSEGDDRSRGWPTYLASTVNDSENEDEVTGGKLLIWAPDDRQQFPSDWGSDGKVFTNDDPVVPVPAGYSVVDLDQQPFAITREREPQFTLYEPTDAAIKDFSGDSYTEAFAKMFEQIRREYAFNGIEGKEPDWDQLYADLMPRVSDAERERDPQAFYEALRDFTLGFRDGHVGLNGGEFAQIEAQQQIASGYGLAVRELDDGSFVAAYVTPDGPAAQAGIAVGATVTRWGAQPIADATSAVQPGSGPFSTDFALRFEQQRYLTRAPEGTPISVTFANPGEAERSATLTAVPERDSFFATSPYRNYDPNALPVEFEILPSGAGYVKVNSNYDDLNLLVRLFERALQTFEQNQLPGVIIDMRVNSGGNPLGLAGFLTDREITLAQQQYWSDATGQFENEGNPQKIYPNENQYRFPQLVLLVDQTCYSACEIEAYGFSQLPGIVVMGQYPTAGVEAEVSRGQYALPEGMSLQVPTGRFVLPDGSIFLEGTGVEPTRRVPITRETVLTVEDVVLQAAERVITGE